MSATVYTDASFKDGYCGGAFWFASRSHGVIVRHRDAFRFKCDTISKAEMYTIMRAVHFAVSGPYAQKEIHVRTDSMYCVNRLTGVKKPKWSREKKFLKWLNDNSITLIVRHVKGHAKGDHYQAWCNRYCDMAASQMRKHGTFLTYPEFKKKMKSPK